MNKNIISMPLIKTRKDYKISMECILNSVRIVNENIEIAPIFNCKYFDVETTTLISSEYLCTFFCKSTDENITTCSLEM